MLTITLDNAMKAGHIVGVIQMAQDWIWRLLVVAAVLTNASSSDGASQKPTEKEKTAFSRQFAKNCRTGKNIRQFIEILGGGEEHQARYCSCVGEYFADRAATRKDFNFENKKSPFFGKKLNLEAREYCLSTTYPAKTRNYEKAIKKINSEFYGLIVEPAIGNTIEFPLPAANKPAQPELDENLRLIGCSIIKNYNLYDTNINVRAINTSNQQVAAFFANLKSCKLY